MKDYASMSDFEINAAVFEALHGGAPDYKEGDGGAMILISYEGGVVGGDAVEMEVERGLFDPCNNHADAWPIITATGISLIKCTVDSVCWSAEIITDIDDVTDNLFQCQSSFDYQDENPLRCAMIVFLMMKEGE